MKAADITELVRSVDTVKNFTRHQAGCGAMPKGVVTAHPRRDHPTCTCGLKQAIERADERLRGLTNELARVQDENALSTAAPRQASVAAPTATAKPADKAK